MSHLPRLLMLIVLFLPAMAQAQVGLLDEVRSEYQPNHVRDSGDTGPTRFWWVQGPLRERGTELTADRSERLEVNATHWEVVEFDRSFNEADLFSAVLEDWKDNGYEEIFQCEGSSCGSSQSWANAVFGQSILYGIDRYQHYSTGTMGGDIRVLYAVRRGTQVNYLYWLEAVRTRAVDRLASTLLSGQAVLADQHPEERWAQLLDEHEDWTLRLVGHAQIPGFETAQEEGREAAETVRQAWIEAGVPSERLEAESVGFLAPLLDRQVGVTVVLPPRSEEATRRGTGNE